MRYAIKYSIPTYLTPKDHTYLAMNLEGNEVLTLEDVCKVCERYEVEAKLFDLEGGFARGYVRADGTYSLT